MGELVVESQVVQPGDLRSITFYIKLANLDYDLTGVTDLVLRRYGPNNAIVEKDIASGLLEIVAGTDGVLKLHPDNDYWPSVEGLYRFSADIVDVSDPSKTWFIPSDPRKMPRLNLLIPESSV